MAERIVIIGPGAIGGVTAGFMAQAGLDVTLVCKHQSIAAKAAGDGLHITGFRGEHHIPVKSVCRVDELEGLFDLCLIATKAYDMQEIAGEMLPHLKADSLVVTMQNGICTDMLAQVVGADRTVGCVIGFGGTMHGDAELEMTSSGDFVIGMAEGGTHPRLNALRDALATVTNTRISPDIYAELYSKLIVNSCITSLGALCGLTLGEMMKVKQARRIFLAVIGEAVDVAKAMHLAVPPYGSKLDYFSLMKGSSVIDNLRRHLMIRIVGMKYSKLKSSSLQSLERGRPTEIDCFNGYIMTKAAEKGIDVPVNRRLVEMVHEIEQKKRSICVENLSDKVFADLPY